MGRAGAAPRPLHEVSLPVASLEVAVRQARDELSRFALALAEAVAPITPAGTSPDTLAATLMNLAPA